MTLSRPVTEDSIAAMVDRFYARVRADPLLGPVFERVIGDDWTTHLQTMRDFWSSVLLKSGRYGGNPLIAHKRLSGVTPELFDRWLALFGATLIELFEPEIAADIRLRAERIAASLKLAMFYSPDDVERRRAAR